ncbi:MAG: hypothetical protein IJ300_06155, partial [Clostridia bacterium]|nr:hypothetical protein [Clostridia bacterium]
MSYEIQPINPTNIKKVTDLDDRPNITGEYGKSALTAKELKERFDSYANEVRLKVEEILKAFSSTVTTETTDDGPIAVAGNGNYIALDLDDDPNDKKQAKLGESLADLVASFFTGAFAARLMVDLGEDEESDNLHSLLSILNAHIDKFSKLEEEKFDKHYNEEREIYENQIVTEQIKDGAVTHDKLGKDLTDSLSSLEGNKIKS